MIDPRWIPVGYQQIAAFSTVQTLTPPAGATAALIRVETTSVRWRDDGTAPTASVGQLLLTTDAPFWYPGVLSALQFIPTSSTSTLDVTYYR